MSFPRILFLGFLRPIRGNVIDSNELNLAITFKLFGKFITKFLLNKIS